VRQLGVHAGQKGGCSGTGHEAHSRRGACPGTRRSARVEEVGRRLVGRMVPMEESGQERAGHR
jgi:hypothetical protein